MKKLENLLLRENSCLTKKKIKNSLIKIIDFPVFFGCVDTPISKDLKTDMEFFIEEKTGLIQLNKLIPLEIIYQSQHAFGVGKVWDQHYEKFSKFIFQDKNKSIIEIGGATEKLANKYLNLIEANWTVIEPNPTSFKNKKIKVIKGFFEDSNVIIDTKDTIVFSHVLEHAYDPALFLEKIFKKINPKQNLYFSYPRLEIWLKYKYTNALNFEHTIFLTEPHLDILLKNIGFEIINKTHFIDHSIFYHLKKSTPKKIEYPNLFKINKSLLDNFFDYHFKDVKKLNKVMSESDSEFFLFGAHIFSQFLIVLGLRTEKIKFILDNSVEKQNLRLYGTDLFVKSPKILKNKNNPIIILRAANYNNEIKEDILNNINPNTNFI